MAISLCFLLEGKSWWDELKKIQPIVNWCIEAESSFTRFDAWVDAKKVCTARLHLECLHYRVLLFTFALECLHVINFQCWSAVVLQICTADLHQLRDLDCTEMNARQEKGLTCQEKGLLVEKRGPCLLAIFTKYGACSGNKWDSLFTEFLRTQTIWHVVTANVAKTVSVEIN